jgi:uncharacterized damage-inducible protein DinB
MAEATSQAVPAGAGGATGERAEVLQMLAAQREVLLITVRGLDDAQAAARTTVSDLTLGGIVKHLAQGHRAWTQIMSGQPGTPDGFWDTSQYYLADGDTLAGLLEAYAAGARATEEAVAALPSLDVMVPLPEAPWAPGVVDRWSARRILLHLLRETAQHAGHADIIRQSLDGAITTGQLGT